MYAGANMGHPSNSQRFVVNPGGPENSADMDRLVVSPEDLKKVRGIGRVPHVRPSVRGTKTSFFRMLLRDE
jgi:hypothetical protein